MRILELKSLARERRLRNYSRMRKAELVALLQNNHPPAPRTRPPRPTRPPLPPPPTQTWEPIDVRRPRKPSPQEMDMFEQQEMSKSRPQIKTKLNKWYDWLINHVPKPIKDGASKAFKTFKDKVMGLYNRVTGSTGNETRIKEPKPFKPIELEQAFGGAYRSYRINGRPKIAVDTFFNRIGKGLIELIKRELKTRTSARIQTTAWIRFVRDDEEGQERVELAFNSSMTSVYRESETDQILDGMIANMKFQIENPALLNSSFVFDEFLYLDVNFHQLNLTRGSSYLPLPDWLARKKAIVNPHNNDEECFKWSVIAAEKVGMKDPQRVSNLRKFKDNYDWSGLEFPVSIKDIGKFETRNNISVNVLAVEGRDIYIHRKGQRMGREINLLMVSEDGINHYTAIKSLSRLLKSSNTKHKCKQHFCMNCLQGFTQELSRDQHQVYCEDNESVRVEMPKQGSTIEFKDGQNQFKVPPIMYADFESILEPMDSVEPGSPNQPYTNEVNQHTPSGWCLYSKFAYGDVDNPLRTYRGKDCIETFCNYIKGEAHRLYHMFPKLPMGPLTKKQWKKYKRSTKCHICYKPFTLKDPKVRDHCHYTGLYRGPAHSLCNLRYKIPSYIPVVFHNLSGYDAHLFIRELGAHASDMEVIAKNKEDYISFSIKVPVDSYIDKNGEEKDKLIELRFIDSFKFMSSSLDSLTKNLVRGGKKLFGFEDYSELQYGLLTRKGVYPYEYINSWDRFEETKLLPISAFYSNLNMSSISEEDYQHAQRVWKKFGIHNLGDYHDLYLITDVVLLANVFEAFRNTCLRHYKLDPAHFYTSPGLAWKACLKRTGIRLELLTDPDMLLMFERGIRGGITQAVRKYASANNKYMGDKFNLNEDTTLLQYLDGNNLYGWAMSQPLPTGGFKWVDVNPNEISELAIRTDKGYLLEVDVSYPKELQNQHNDLSFMCERMEINGVEKLVPNLRDKKNYVIHIQALNQVLQHGLRLDRIHRVIEFDQSPWLKTYIDFNTQLRTAATNDFEKDFFKLMNNSVLERRWRASGNIET